MRKEAATIAGLFVLAGCASAQSTGDGGMALDPCAVEYIAAYNAGRRLENTDGCIWGEIESQERADRIQAEVARNHPAGGDIVGYKVTNAQDGRVIGVIAASMILPSGSSIDLSKGTRILGEGDLLVRVKSDGINSATTLEDVAAEIEAVIPFIESSDMMLPEGVARTKASWTSSNGNARWGVAGEAVDVSDADPADLVARLAALEVALIDENGEQLQRSSMRNNPLQSVLDVLEDMRRRGDSRLKAGDLISLGNFGRPRFPKPGNTYTAQFHGLASPVPEVTAMFK